MRQGRCGSTRVETVVLVCFLAVALAAGAFFLVALGRRAAEQRRREAAIGNLRQLMGAGITYQEPNGDFFPAEQIPGVDTETE